MIHNCVLRVLFIGGCAVLSACDTFSSGGNLVPKPIRPTIGGKAITNKQDKEEAYKWAKKYRGNYVIIDAASKKGGKSYYFTNGFIDTMRSQKGCVGLNFYITQSDDKEMELILVSVNKDGEDLTSTYKNDKNINEEYIIGRTTMRCPDNCDTSSDMYNKQ